jgi:predicted nucleic acid-binding protein
LKIVGTLTIVSAACDLGYIKSYESVCEDLHKVNFHFTKKVQDAVKNDQGAVIKPKPPRRSGGRSR